MASLHLSLTLLPLKAYTHVHAFGLIQVLAEFEGGDWELILHDFTKYLVFCFPCISQCIG